MLPNLVGQRYLKYSYYECQYGSLVALIFGSFYGYSKFTKEEPVNLRPAITNAINVEITINTCNKQIDEQGFDIRDEEQKLEKELKETEGVKNASVLIQRDQKNCKE